MILLVLKHHNICQKKKGKKHYCILVSECDD